MFFILFLHFLLLRKCFFFLLFLVFLSNMFHCWSLVYCRWFLHSRCSMEMWCPDDTGRDSWDWVGLPAWWRACFNSPEWGGISSPVKTEPPQNVLFLLLHDHFYEKNMRTDFCTMDCENLSLHDHSDEEKQEQQHDHRDVYHTKEEQAARYLVQCPHPAHRSLPTRQPPPPLLTSHSHASHASLRFRVLPVWPRGIALVPE